jgi:hypothetical protein
MLAFVGNLHTLHTVAHQARAFEKQRQLTLVQRTAAGAVVRLQAFGGYAANLLRLSEQVPVRAVFLTDGKPRKIRYGRQLIELRRASPRMMAAAGRTNTSTVNDLLTISLQHKPTWSLQRACLPSSGT